MWGGCFDLEAILRFPMMGLLPSYEKEENPKFPFFTMGGYSKTIAVCKPGRGLNLPAPESGLSASRTVSKKMWLKPPSLWHFVTAAQATTTLYLLNSYVYGSFQQSRSSGYTTPLSQELDQGLFTCIKVCEKIFSLPKSAFLQGAILAVTYLYIYSLSPNAFSLA